MNIVIRFFLVCLLALTGLQAQAQNNVLFGDGMELEANFVLPTNSSSAPVTVSMGQNNVMHFGYVVENKTNLEVRTLKFRLMVTPLVAGVPVPFVNVRFFDSTLGQVIFGASCGVGCWDFDYPSNDPHYVPIVVQAGQSYQLALFYSVGTAQNYPGASNQVFTVTVLFGSTNQDNQSIPLNIRYTGDPFYIRPQ